jgi:hypothetical protein
MTTLPDPVSPAEPASLPDPNQITLPTSDHRLLAACLRDYARRLVQQQSLYAPPADLSRAYEHAYGSPLHVGTLAEDLLVLASTLDAPPG